MKLLAIVCVSLSALMALSSGKDTFSARVIQAPTKNVEAIRSAIKNAKNIGSPQLFPQFERLGGVKILASFEEECIWDGKSHEYSKDLGAAEPGSEKVPKMVLVLAGKAQASAVSENFITCLELPKGRGDYFMWWSESGKMSVPRGKWTEMAAWGDGKSTTMVWRFTSGEVSGEKDAASDKSPIPFVVDLAMLKASPSDLNQLKKAKPDSSDKAVKGLMSQASVWKEIRVVQGVGPKTNWRSSEGRSLKEDGVERVVDTGLGLDVTGSRADGKLSLKLDLTITAGKNAEDSWHHDVSFDEVSNQWRFIVIEDNRDANVLAYREVVDPK